MKTIKFYPVLLLALVFAIFMVFMGIDCKAEKEVVEEPIKMVWSGWSGEEKSTRPVIDAMIGSWNEVNPNSTVKWVGWPWSETLGQLIIRSQAGEGLDVAQIDMRWLSALDEADVLVDLDTVFEEGYLKDNFGQAVIEIGKIDGKQIGLPWTLASIGMVYNPSLLEGAGIENVPETIEEFEKACEALKDKYPDIIPYGAVTKDPGSMTKDFGAWLWTFGGSIFDENGNVVINSPEGVAALTWYKGLLDKGYIAMDSSRFDIRVLYSQNVVGFYDDAVMCNGILRTNMELEADASVDECIMPMLRPVLKTGDVSQSAMWGHLLVILKSAQDKQRAGAFLQHVVSEEQALNYFNTSAMLPVIKSAIESNMVKNNTWASKWSEITSTGRTSETSLYASAAEMDTIISEEVQAALLGTKTPQKALDDAATRLKSVIVE